MDKKSSHNFDYDVSAFHFGGSELSLYNPALSAVKDPAFDYSAG